MKESNDRPFVDSGFAVMRTPLLPITELAQLSEGLAAPGAGAGDLAACLAGDEATVARRLFAMFRRPEVREALFLASPSLFDASERSQADPSGPSARAVARGLFRYFTRLCSRPTPFGLLAGSTVIPVAAASRLELGPRASYRSHLQLDAGLLDATVTEIERRADCRAVLRYAPNSTLFQRGANVLYVESQPSNTGLRDNVVTSVGRTRALDLALAAAGQATAAEIASALAGALEISAEDAAAYVDQLIDAQLLVPNIQLSVTGAPALQALVQELAQVGAPASVVDPLRRIDQALTAMDSQPIGRDPARYRELLSGLPGHDGEPLPAPAFHVELYKPAPGASVGAAVLREAESGIRALAQLAAARRETALDRFRAAFIKRYGARSVRLVDALDDQSGVGFDPEGSLATSPAPLLDGLGGGGRSRTADQVTSGRDQALLALYVRAVAAGAQEIRLQEAELAALQTPGVPPLPDAFSALFTIIASSAADVDAGRFQLLLRGTFGPSGATSLGRFGHGDPALADSIRKHLQQEEALRPECLFAEISHRSQPRLGNVVGRPVLRPYEIPYLSRGGTDQAHRIAVDDLWLSVADRIVLWSQRLDREVVPRLAAAHSVGPAELPIYRFLTALQTDTVLGQLAFDWGFLAAAPFLPRVVFGRSVLFEATWRLEHAQLTALAAAGPAARYDGVQKLRAQLRLPRWIWAGDGDERLCLDLEQVLAVETLIELARGSDLRGADARAADLIVREAFVGAPELCVMDGAQPTCHELLVPYVRARPRSPARRPAAKVATVHAVPLSARRRCPGSDWLSVKIYCGPASTDQVLLEGVEPVASAALAAGHLSRWFFLRYADPRWHLRARFQGASWAALQGIVPELRQRLSALIDDEVVSSIEIDTYEREIERHGGLAAQPLVEGLWAADSVAVVRTLAGLEGDVGARRWQACLLGLDSLLATLGLTTEARVAVCDDIYASFQNEMGGGPALDHALGRLFRTERARIHAVLTGGVDAAPELKPAFAAFAARTSELSGWVRELHRLADQGRLTVRLHDLAMRLVHLHVNRLMHTRQRQHEMVLCAFLARHYRSQLARRRVDDRDGLVAALESTPAGLPT